MNDIQRFKKLFEPIRIKGMDIRNRFVMAPMLGGSDKEGFATEQMKNWYGECAKGGVGMIILGAVCVESTVGRLFVELLIDDDKFIPGLSEVEPLIDDDKFIPGLSEVAEAIKRHNARAVIQIFHAGHGSFSSLKNVQPVSASAIARPGGEIPRELTVSEVEDMVNRFAKSAERAKKAGFDAVEIHAANRYLINSFLSPAWNKRQDRYGGDLKNRTRFLVDIIKSVREAVGEDYPIFCRINGMEYGVENGIDLKMAQEIAKIAQDAGLDVIDVSAVNPHTSARPSFYWSEGCCLHLAEGVKKVVDIPVIIAGRNTPELGEAALQEKKADFIAIARPMIADPDLPNKVSSGKLDEIIPCQSCNSCRGGTRGYPGAVCAINPVAQRQWEYRLRPAEKSKKVLVIGGGPAGMLAAREAALRGHSVTLYDLKDRLGGQLLLAAIPPCKEKINALVEYLANQLYKTGVQVRLGEEATVELVEESNPDVVLVATGANPIIPDIPGIEGKNVVTALDVLWDINKVGEKVVVVGGGLIGCETSDFLAEKGKNVTILEMLDQIGGDIGPNRGDVLDRLEKAGVRMVVKKRMEEITPEGVKATREGSLEFFEADTVVLAIGLTPDTALASELEGRVPEIRLIGDCVKPRRILEAIHDGFNAAWEL